MKRSLLALCLVLSFVFCGCFSSKPHQMNITAAYSFEGRYDSNNKITIDDCPIEIKTNESVWLLSNNTLFNLLTSVSESSDKIVFGDKRNRTYVFDRKTESASILQAKDSFDDEEYVWENWTIPTNGVR